MARPIVTSIIFVNLTSVLDDYSALRTSVIGALKANLGIDVQKLSMFHVKEDLRQSLHCWISKQLPATVPYGQIICYEHRYEQAQTILKAVDDIFRAMMPLFNNQNRSVITPLLATGFQVVNRAAMIREMINVAVSWMLMGLPLQTFKIVVYSKSPNQIRDAEKSAIEMFYEVKKKIEKKTVIMKEPSVKTDVFLVYCDSDVEIVSLLRKQLAKGKQTKKILTLSDVSVKEDTWKHDIFTEMLASARIVPVLSKGFLESEVCVDQYNIATCCNRFTNRNILAPICLERCDVPLYMSMVQWINCRERDTQRVKDAAVALNQQIKNTENSLAKKYDVFLSYCHKNLEYAKQVMKLLQRNTENLRIFFDYAELKTGVSWQQTLYHAIDSSRCVVSLVSKDYLKSEVCKEEYSLAVTKHYDKGEECRAIAIVIEPPTKDLVSFLGEFPYVDGSGQPSGLGIENICQGISKWLSSGTADREVFGPDKGKVDITAMTSLQRKKLFHKLYSYSKRENEFALTKMPQLWKGTQVDDSKDSYDIFLSCSLWDQHYVHFVIERLKKYHPELKLCDKLQSSENQISEGRCCIVFLSSKYLGSPKEVEELNLILSRQRSHKGRQIMYILRVDDLPAVPYYPGILWCDTCLTDDLWDEFVSTTVKGDAHTSLWNTDINQLSKEVEKEFKKQLKEKEVAALLKCVCDLDAVLRKGRYYIQENRDCVFVNAHTLNKAVQQEESQFAEKMLCTKEEQKYDTVRFIHQPVTTRADNSIQQLETRKIVASNEYGEVWSRDTDRHEVSTDENTIKVTRNIENETEESDKVNIEMRDNCGKESESTRSVEHDASSNWKQRRFDENTGKSGSNSQIDGARNRQPRTAMCRLV